MTAGQLVRSDEASLAVGSKRHSGQLVAEGFNANVFADNFDVLAQAEGGVKRLREMVLGLAARGVLVAQEPSEGSSATLVANLQTSRERLSQTSRVRTDLVDVPANEAPFDIPPTWHWVRLGHLGGFLGGGTPSKSNSTFWDGPIPWVSPKDMKRAYIDDAEDHISKAAVEGSAVKLIPNCSLLFVVRGMILAHSFPVALTTKSVTINQDMKALVLAVPATAEYLLRACWAARMRILQRVERSSHGTCRLDTEVVEELPIPLPPLAEQKRIVARVDELMRLIDDLEVKQAKKRETQTRLRTAALDALTSAEGPEEFEAAWRRVAENFGALFEKVSSVSALRACVLSLAALGRLVEPSCERPIDVPSGEAYEPEFVIPPHWAWSPLGRVCQFIDYRGRTPVKTAHGVPLITAKNVRMGTLREEPREYIAESAYHGWMTRGLPQYGDVLFTTEAPLGNVAQLLTSERIALAQRIITLRPIAVVDPAFLKTLMMSPVFQNAIRTHATGTTAMGIKAAKLKLVPFPVPPMQEQQRIVAKVEHLMKLCDNLEAKLRRAEETAAKLVEAAVAEMVA